MTVEDKNFNIKNGLTVGTGKHQVLDSAGRLTANYITLNTGGRYLSAGVDLHELISRSGVPPVSTNRWNDTYERVLYTGDNWDSVYSWVNSDSATNNSDYNRTVYVNASGDTIHGDIKIVGETYLQNHLRVDGQTYLSGATYVENDTYVMGNLRVDGDVELAVEGVYPKSIYMGATNDDRVVFRADVDSNIIPDDTISYDLGTSEQQWRELFVRDVSASRNIWVDNDLMISGNGTVGRDFRVSGHGTIEGNTVLSGTLDVKQDTTLDNNLRVSGYTNVQGNFAVSGNTSVEGNTVLSGTLDVEDFATFYNDLSVHGDLYVDGNAYLSAGSDGVINVGDKNTDSVVFYADVDSNIIPDDTISYDLGTSEQQWRELFVHDVSATHDIWIDNDLMVSGNGTVENDFRVSGHGTIEGNTTLSGTLGVKQDTTLDNNLRVSGYTNVQGNLAVSANTTVEGNTTLSGTLDVKQDTTLDNNLRVSGYTNVQGNLAISGNTNVEGNTVLSGTLDVKDFTTLHDDLSVKGDLYVDGNAYLSAGIDGNIYVGDTNTDNVVFNADVNSSLIPQTHHAFNIGTDDKHWGTLYVRDVSANGDIKINDTLFVDKIKPDDTTRDMIDINAGTINLQSGPDIESGSGMSITSNRIRFNSERFTFGDVRESVDGWRPWVLDINVDDQTTILTTTLTGKLDATFEQNLTVLGNTIFGTDNTDNVIFNADVDSNIIPDDDVTFDLGTGTQQWRELFVRDISASNDIFVDNDLLVSANGTIGQDFRVSGHTTVSGNTVLSGTLDVDDATNIYDTLDVELDTHLHSNLFVTDNTTISGNTVLSGALDVDDATYVYDTLDVELKTTLHNDLLVSGDTHIVGDLRVDGNAYLSAGVDGIINVGDTNTDNVVFRADINSGLTPNKDVTFDLGSSTQQWRELFVQDVSASRDIWIDNDLMVSGNGTVGRDFRVSGHGTIEGNTTLSGALDVKQDTTLDNNLRVSGYTNVEGNLAVSGNTNVEGNTVLSGTLDVKQFTSIHDSLSVQGDLYVDGSTYLSAGVDGVINVGDKSTDNVVFYADVDSNIIPDDTISYDLGTSEQQWRELFVHDISASRDVDIDRNLTVTGHVSGVSGLTIAGDTTLSGQLSVTSNTHMLSNLTVDESVYIKGNIVVEGHSYFGFGGTSGQINIGNDDIDEIIFQADVGTHILPYPSVTYDLGSLSKRWRTLYIRDIKSSGTIETTGDITTTEQIIQTRDYGSGRVVDTKNQIWRATNGSSVADTVTIKTFEDRYQSVKYTIMVKAANGITTTNATFVSFNANVNGTIYGNATIGTEEPLIDIGCELINGSYMLSVTCKRYSDIMVTGEAMHLS